MKTLDDLQKQMRYGSDKHKLLSEAITARVKMSRDRMSERYKQMAQNEEHYNAYVPAKDVDRVRADRKQTSGEHDYVSVEVPYGYATIMTIHTYVSSVFLARAPIYQVQARHGEPEMNVQALEALLDYQLVAGKHLMPLFVGLFDPLKYGFGVIGQYWDTEELQVRQFVDEIPTFLGMPIPGAKPKRVPKVERLKAYEGTKLFNVRPQDFFPDPRVPMWKFQEGEFCARYVEIPWSELGQGEADGRYFNVKDAKKAGSTETTNRDKGSSRVTQLPGDVVNAFLHEKPSSLFKGYEIQWKISPKQWRLGDESFTETWVFTISDSGVIVEARPFGLYYQGFGYDLFMYEPDGYNLFPTSALERIKPLNDVLSWLINTHFYNVRAALNNQFIYDPSMVVEKDVVSRKPGQLIRLKPAAYGRDVRMAIHQLPVGDVTRAHLNDAQIIEIMIQRVLGATDQVMGMVDSGGRKTATEVRTSTSFGVNRIKTLTELASASGFAPMVQRLVQTTQQLYSDDKKYRLVGDLSSFAPAAMQVDAESIAGFYDYVPVDGTLPVDRYAQAQLWQTMMAQMFQVPQIVQQYDIAKIYAWVASLAGLKNIQQFRLVANDPAAMQQQAQAGNLVPMDDAMQDLNRVPDEGRPEGMGATG